MLIAVVHGYLLRGTGSNLYVSNLCRTFTRQGHRVLLFSQEGEPAAFASPAARSSTKITAALTSPWSKRPPTRDHACTTAPTWEACFNILA